MKELIRKLRSVRVALTFWYSVIFLSGFLIFGGVVYVYLYRLQRDAIESDLTEETDWIAELIQVEQRNLLGMRAVDELSDDFVNRISEHFSENPNNYMVVITDVRGVRLFESDNAGDFDMVTLVRPGNRIVIQSLEHPTQGSIRVAARWVGPLLVQVGFTDRSIGRTLNHVLAIFAVIVPVVLLLAVAGGWIMSGAILDPVRRISAVAREITGQNLSGRIPSRGVGDELDELVGVMNAMIVRLEKAFDQMKEFSMNVAHELRTPLTILKGESELALSRNLSNDEAHRILSNLLEEIVRMSRLVDDLLTLAKADAGQLAVEERPVRLDLLLEEIADDAAVLGSVKNLHVRLASNPEVTITGDSARLHQLFRALISNAVHYTDPRGSITIRSEVSSGAVSVRIRDTGIGIPAESIGRIFERFYRVEQARTRVSGGSGLGLALAKWIAELHHATLTVESEQGVGSEFTVRFPLPGAPQT
jgi:two-component system OmpR family sensor kinase